ncbi:MAG: DNA gyrase inhibitor YacG [Cycloclasticus sp.]|nr:MAG: DNA gyrase inhibitor YacG [Cycloclasticus sp.]
MPTSVTCPTCHKIVVWNHHSNFKPFCSERCKLIDLGDWALEKHVVVGEEVLLTEENNEGF